jgi:hypothetical protein
MKDINVSPETFEHLQENRKHEDIVIGNDFLNSTAVVK